MSWREQARKAGAPAVRYVPGAKPVIQVQYDGAVAREYSVNASFPSEIGPLLGAAYEYPYRWVWEE